MIASLSFALSKRTASATRSGAPHWPPNVDPLRSAPRKSALASLDSPVHSCRCEEALRSEVCPRELGCAEGGLGEAGASEGGVAEVRPPKVRALRPRPVEARSEAGRVLEEALAQVGLEQQGHREVDAREVRATQPRHFLDTS